MMHLLLNDIIFQALGMTILHSVWQVLVVFIMVQLALYMLKRSSSQIKYSLLGFSLLAIFFISCATFIIYIQKYQTNFSTISALSDLSITGERLQDYMIRDNFSSKLSFSSLINQLYITTPYISGIYLMVVIFLSLSLLLNLNGIQRIRRFGVAVHDQELQLKFEKLKCIILPDKNKVKLIESALIKVPVVIGYLKPLVIVPVGILTQIPYNQLEAILAHELAHIKRHDFIINIFQSVVEILFFYHPVIYIISNRMRSERENCCDDFALDYCSSTQYAKALANMEILRIRNSFPAVAFVKQKENLLKRIQRILKQEKMKTKMTDRLYAGFIILSGFITILLTGSASLNNSSEYFQKSEFNKATEIAGNQFNATSLPIHPIDTSVIIEKNSLLMDIEGEDGKNHVYRMEFNKGKLSALFVDDKKIPETDHVLYKDLISKTLSDVKKARKEIDEIDEEKIKVEIKSAQKEIENIDIDKIRREVSEARLDEMQGMEKLNLDSILQEVNVAIDLIPSDLNIEMEHLSVVIHDEINKARKELQEPDVEEIRKELEEAGNEIKIELREIDFSEIQKTVEDALKEIDIEEIKNELNRIKINIEIKTENIDQVEKSLENTLEEMKNG